MTEQEQLMIEWACEKLSRNFALLNDARRWDEAAALFTEDGLFARPTAPDSPLTGRGAILEAFRSRPADRVTRHFCANTVITVETPDRAVGVTYILLFTGRQPAPDAAVIPDAKSLVGEYHDRFQRTAEGWRFAERRGRLSL